MSPTVAQVTGNTLSIKVKSGRKSQSAHSPREYASNNKPIEPMAVHHAIIRGLFTRSATHPKERSEKKEKRPMVLRRETAHCWLRPFQTMMGMKW